MKTEKKFRESKKAIAFLFIEAIHALFVMTGFLLPIPGVAMSPVLIAVVINMGFIAAGYIGGTAWLDRHVRIAKINAGSTDNE